ncbi:tryptophan synthase subunit alpha [Lentzea tibetensis]|uniref:tryptophan synthase n=1 Tax=Lentzea tibetensis TaxID=2591470 RepID=A0A563EML3_9PSEU|nr:tryptophan synthase subunit alpha [Lentzea tibetensis]TWP48428.1 tryptophan synthase subunit alpha [Lentzea tibetensis]
MADRFFDGADPGLVLFLNAGDPPLPVLRDVVQMLDDQRVDCLELAVPFPDSFTDGPVVRRSAQRALDQGVDLPAVLEFLDATPRKHLRIALLADWSHTVKPTPIGDFVARVADSAADALLVHGLPPRLRSGYYAQAAEHAVPLVTTCYPGSSDEVRRESAHHASAYLYLVAHYGRSGSRPATGFDALRDPIAKLRTETTAPIAVGFGARTRQDVVAIHAAGADAVVIGSGAVEQVESDPVGNLSRFVHTTKEER